MDKAIMYKVSEIKTLGKTRDSEAKKLLETIAKQVQPIMIKRGWKVQRLTEFYPRNNSLLGLNVNRGSEIKIRMRPPNRESEFYPYEALLGTMLHELTHNKFGPHDSKFYNLLDEITKECEELMAKGITGTGQGFDAAGNRLGGSFHNPPLISLREKALSAAQKRAQLTCILPSGPQRLGGNRELMRVLKPGEASAIAAARRRLDDVWCGATKKENELQEDCDEVICLGDSSGSSKNIDTLENEHGDTGKSTGGVPGSLLSGLKRKEREVLKMEESNWTCSLCTLKNQAWALLCEACGSQRSMEKTQAWACRFCTFQNPFTGDKCGMCDQWRYS